MKLFLTVIAALLLLATAIPLPARSQSDVATVYFYRVEEVDKLDSHKVTVKMDGKDLLAMPEQNFIGISLPTGSYGLKMRQKQSEMLLKVEAGKRYFVRVSQTVVGFEFRQELSLMPEDQAIYQMRDMKPLEDKNMKDKSKVLTRDRPK